MTIDGVGVIWGSSLAYPFGFRLVHRYLFGDILSKPVSFTLTAAGRYLVYEIVQDGVEEQSQWP